MFVAYALYDPLFFLWFSPPPFSFVYFITHVREILANYPVRKKYDNDDILQRQGNNRFTLHGFHQ